MYVLQVLNSANEWELITRLFATEAQAVAYYNTNLKMFDDYEVVQLQADAETRELLA
jgi:hypothetical protein